MGGGIENGALFGPGHLDLTNSTLSGNQATGGSGGGVAAGGGLDNSFFVTATITGSQIINNQALGGAGGPGVNGGAAVGGGISVGSGVFFDFTGFFDASSLTITGSTIASNTARGGNGGSGANGGDGLGGGIWFGLPTSPPPQNSIDNSVITGNFALGGQAGTGGSAGPRRWPLRRHQRLGQPEEIARHPELRLHQQRQHLWHGDLPLSATAIFPRQPDFPRTHHRRPGEGPFPLWPFASIGRAVPLAEPSWNPVRGELGNQSPQVTLAESLGKERRGCAGRPRTGLRSSPHDRPGQAT